MANPAFWNGKRVLVTGHTGFKGSWLSLWLLNMGAKVTGLALEPPTDPSLFALAGLERRMDSRIGDIRDPAAVDAAVRAAEPEILIHMAAQPLVRLSYDEPVETFATNVMGTVHVLEAARRCPSLRACVVVTTDKCYENREWPWPYRETEPMGGYDPYSASKGCAELVTSAWRRSFFGKPEAAAIASARAGNVIGGGDWALDRLVPDCMRALMAGRAIPVRNPHAIRPWQHVLEPLGGYLLLAERLWGNPADHADAWNFGPSDDDARPVSWIVSHVVGRWGDGAAWELIGGDHPHEATYLRVDSSKARMQLGWEPRLGLADCLDWTVDWFRRYHAGENVERVTLDQIERYEQMDGKKP
ncbi:CDP-glucose 4,6-dehydratase [Azospirillum brasilense]|uniref:CDP-glucose 4,6-dehydratase n=1 Tax=Azospirillum brasilense TaxID=192 RepID=UPI000E0BABC2|nr:CDP-glucose 4,6-dehydratase [Azospirillum brasilense]